MKSNKAIVLLSICCLILFCSCIYLRYRLYVSSLFLQSDVKAPVGIFMQEIVEDLDNGRSAEAERKIRFLEKEWQAFRVNSGFVEGLGDLLVKARESGL